MTPQIDDEQTKLRRQQRRKRCPISSAIGIAVNQDQRRGVARTQFQVREPLSVRQHDRCFLRLEAIEIGARHG